MRPHLYNVCVQYGGVSLPCDDIRDAFGVLQFIYAKRHGARAPRAQKVFRLASFAVENYPKKNGMNGTATKPSTRFVPYA